MLQKGCNSLAKIGQLIRDEKNSKSPSGVESEKNAVSFLVIIEFKKHQFEKREERVMLTSPERLHF